MLGAHHALCQSGALKNGLLLPVSIAMKRNDTSGINLAKCPAYSGVNSNSRGAISQS
ncbi:hypothetical protein [Polynucleobacter asymbioticus]|uniref:hypothetical protein n=1 Tax=Polynucleobacter asymbioticus TaxID=576611 RepID=UPI000A802066|nr:hypothetical protein [Polynucleobacter asymbioticus]